MSAGPDNILGTKDDKVVIKKAPAKKKKAPAKKKKATAKKKAPAKKK